MSPKITIPIQIESCDECPHYHYNEASETYYCRKTTKEIGGLRADHIDASCPFLTKISYKIAGIEYITDTELCYQITKTCDEGYEIVGIIDNRPSVLHPDKANMMVLLKRIVE